ncbi:MAG: sugar phosphate isomerase/epimerase [Clostridia bacterium]|nr:sugar phosphate isomerase/epimerase [Clostridia bacterium]
MIKGVLCSSGALITRYNGRDPRLLKEFFPHIEADGLEFMVYPAWDGMLGEVRETVRSIQKELSIPIPVLHADKRIGELISLGSKDDIREAGERFKNNCLIAEELGSSLMVLHLWGGPASDHNIERNISQLAGCAEEAKKHGVTLTVENVVCAVSTPLAHIKRIMAEFPDALFTIDTKMAEFHLEMPETLACGELWQGRAAHLHVNDYSGGLKDFSDLRVRHIGEGHVDFAPFFKKVRECGYSGYATVESTSVLPDGSVDFEKLGRSLGTVRKNLM